MDDEEVGDAVYGSDAEGDETVTLSEIVAGREVTLGEEELWALCRECCLTLEFVHSTQELFQSLVITPETVAFDREGNVCFLDLDADPEPLYIPPEYEEDGCSYKSHLYSLGMTLLFAVEYSDGPENEDSKSALSQDLTGLLTHLTQDDPEDRPDLELVLEYCDRALQDLSSQDVCQRFACAPAEGQFSKGEVGTSLLSMTEELAAYLHNQTGLVTPAQRASNSNSDSDSSKAPSKIRQQASSAETQETATGQVTEDVNEDSELQEKKDSVVSNPRSPSMELSQSSAGDDSSITSPRKSRRRQGMLLSDVLDMLDRFLQEAELWALCRECILSLQRKKKHLPAYISPDTVMVREIGSVSFKAIPEDKPLEVIYMAPELQQKGILNEKTCLYGLGITLRCAAGQKYSTAEQLDVAVGPAFQELMTTLLEDNPDLRPSLEVALMACDEFNRQSSIDSRLLCQEFYMDACALMSSREPKKSELPSVDLDDSTVATATEMQTSWTELEDTAREGVFLDDGLEEEEPAQPEHSKTSAFQPISTKQQQAAAGSAFKPVPLKPKPARVTDRENHDQRARLPSAFSSPATHFKPIILQAPGASEAAVGSDQASAELQEEDKEKNVMRKLREIKKNLLKHRPPGSLSKDVEMDDSKPPMAEKPKTPRTPGGSQSRGAAETAGALESFLQQLQSSGQMPDTQNLALAIAQHLQAQLGPGGEAGDAAAKAPTGSSSQILECPDTSSHLSGSVANSLPSAVTSQAPCAETQPQPQNIQLASAQTMPTEAQAALSQPQQVPPSLPLPQFSGPVPGLNMASMGQAGYLGPGMPMPLMPFAGGVMPGPVQYQLQQDPRTGLVQLVPVPVMPYGHPPGPSRSPHTPGSDPGYSPWQQPITISPGAGLVPDYSTNMEDTAVRHSNRPNVNSRSARGLIQKTAAQRAKNAASSSASPTGYLSDNGISSLKSHSGVEEESLQNASSQRGTSRHRRSNSSSASLPLRGLNFSESNNGSVRQGDNQEPNMDYMVTSHSEDQEQQRSWSMNTSNAPQVIRSNSQSSSPSPSKDSGICLTHGSAAPPVSSASLMERLLSSESLRHQQTVTQVLHILNQGFGDQGPNCFQSEELLAEYIVSLAHLKWETFMHAVTEKYTNLFWSHTLLVNLYHAVNGQSASSARPSAKIPPASRSKPFQYGDEEVTPQIQNPRDIAHSRLHSEPSSTVPQGGEEKEGEAPSQRADARKTHSEAPYQQRVPPDNGFPAATESAADAGESQSMVRVLANGRYVSGPSETSDSTDNEQQEKRRRFKKRYELDRNKSTSAHSIPGTAKFSQPPEQGVCGSELNEPQASRLQGHGEAPQSDCVRDVRTAKPFADRREVDSSSVGRGLHPDARSSAAPVHAPPSYHSLPRPAKSSQPQHAQSPQHARPDLRDGLVPSRSSASGLSVSCSGASERSPSSAGASGASPAFTPGMTRPYSAAICQSHSPHQHLQGSGTVLDAKQHRPESRSHYRPFVDSPNRHAHGHTVHNSSPSQHSHSLTNHSSSPSQRSLGSAGLNNPSQQHSHGLTNLRGSPSQHSHGFTLNNPNPSQHTLSGTNHSSSPGQHAHSHPYLNNSSGSSSYSPAFSQNSKESVSGNSLHPEQQSRHLSAAAAVHADSEGFVYGQHREPLGKPPSSASPKITRNLRGTHSPQNSSGLGESGNGSNSRTPLTLYSAPSRSEVNNNARKRGDADREVRGMVGPARNRDRSPVRKTQHKMKPQLSWDKDIAEYRKKGQVVYHSAMIQLSMTPEVDRFIHDIDEDNKASIANKLMAVEQELTMQRRQRRKSQAFYKRLTEPGNKQPKGENKTIVSQVLKDMSEMTSKMRFLDLCRTHLQMLLTELYGLDTCFLHTLVNSGGGEGEDPQPLVLQPYLENQLLQFQTVREATTGCEVQVLQAGHPPGLMAYLFTLSALSDGYIHQFLFCFRYFLKAEDVFTFITQKYLAARRGNQNDVNIVRTQQRAMDLLQFWVEGYYSLDFERNDALLDRLETFVLQRVEEGMEGSQNLMNLLYACHLGENTELVSQADDSEDHDEVYYLHLAAPKRWESFRSLLGRKKSEGIPKPSRKEAAGVPYKEKGGVLVEKRPPSRAEEGSTTSLSRRADNTQLMDYAPHRLAEQLTLMEQDLFQRTHPVHFLDSKAQGVGVDLSMPSLRTPSMARKSNPDAQSLFVGTPHFESRAADMISHSQEIIHWVSAEILCCGSQKSQVSALTKFLATAQLCVEIRNYATALAIIAGLDNLLVRQLPAWKHLPAKAATLMDDLEALQVKVKGEPMAMMQDKDSHMYPTIPCVLYFLLHLQQLEIGGFTLANGMFKWQKMRSICQMVDQIRIFREHEYGFEPDYELQSLICRRLHELSDRDLHTVAAAHDNNFRRVVSNAAGLQGTWRKVKVKLQSRTK